MHKQRESIGILLSLLLLIGSTQLYSCFSPDSKKRGSSLNHTKIEADTLPSKEPDSLHLLFVGDIMVHSTQYHSARYEGKDTTYNFYPVFQHVEAYLSHPDWTMGNLETTLAGKPYSGYPLFSSPSEIADDLKKAGFDLLFTANNHTVDRGKKGLESTLGYLNQTGLLHTGSFQDTVDREVNYPLLVKRNNISLSILNYTYGTNGMPVRKPNIVNQIDTLQILLDLEKAKAQQSDVIMVCMHWGIEYEKRENKEQQQIARLLAEKGAHLIVGAHPHVVQGYEEIITEDGRTVPVIYSLGNFISNQQWRYADGGIAFEAIFVKKDQETTIAFTGYEPLWVNRYRHEGQTIYRLIPVNDYLLRPQKYDLNDQQITKMNLFYEDTRKKLPNLHYGSVKKVYSL